MARTERFLEANTKLIIRQKGSKAVWYTTKKEIVLEGMADVLCPLTQDPVLTTTEKGVEVFFPARIVRERVILEDGDVNPDLLKSSLTLIDYDVHHNPGYSPCARLHRVAVPMSESVWLVRTGDIPWKLIGEMRDMGCTVDTTDLDPKETQRKVARAVGELQKKVREAIERNQASLEAAYAKLQRSEEEGIEEEAALEAYRKQIVVIEKRIEKLQKDMTEGASRFGLNAKSYGTESLAVTRRAIKFTADERARAYHRGVEALAAVNTADAQAVLAQANNSELPAMILSDILRDADKEEEADAVAETFSLVGNNEESSDEE